LEKSPYIPSPYAPVEADFVGTEGAKKNFGLGRCAAVKWLSETTQTIKHIHGFTGSVTHWQKWKVRNCMKGWLETRMGHLYKGDR
jgi:hypothetical protein